MSETRNAAGDPLAAVCRALTNAQARAINRRFLRLNPQWEGGSTGDFLEALADTDSDLDVTESFYEANPGLAQVPGAAYASRALIWSGQELTAGTLRDLLAKAGLYDTDPEDGE